MQKNTLIIQSLALYQYIKSKKISQIIFYHLQKQELLSFPVKFFLFSAPCCTAARKHSLATATKIGSLMTARPDQIPCLHWFGVDIAPAAYRTGCISHRLHIAPNSSRYRTCLDIAPRYRTILREQTCYIALMFTKWWTSTRVKESSKSTSRMQVAALHLIN